MKKLYRSKENKVFIYIIGGLGEYFEVDCITQDRLRLPRRLHGFYPGVIAVIAIFVVPESSPFVNPGL